MAQSPAYWKCLEFVFGVPCAVELARPIQEEVDSAFAALLVRTNQSVVLVPAPQEDTYYLVRPMDRGLCMVSGLHFAEVSMTDGRRFSAFTLGEDVPHVVLDDFGLPVALVESVSREREVKIRPVTPFCGLEMFDGRPRIVPPSEMPDAADHYNRICYCYSSRSKGGRLENALGPIVLSRLPLSFDDAMLVEALPDVNHEGVHAWELLGDDPIVMSSGRVRFAVSVDEDGAFAATPLVPF